VSNFFRAQEYLKSQSTQRNRIDKVTNTIHRCGKQVDARQ